MGSHNLIAVRCMCDLLKSHPHFNFASNLAKIIVPEITSKNEEVKNKKNKNKMSINVKNGYFFFSYLNLSLSLLILKDGKTCVLEFG